MASLERTVLALRRSLVDLERRSVDARRGALGAHVVYGCMTMTIALLALAVTVLGVFAWVIAVRQALDVTTGRSIGICVLAQIPLILMVLALLASPAP